MIRITYFQDSLSKRKISKTWFLFCQKYRTELKWMSDKDYFRLALEGIEDDLKVDFKSGLGIDLIESGFI